MEVTQEGWEDITLSEYIDIQEILKKSQGLAMRSLEIICYLSDDDSWENEDSTTVFKEYLKINWINSQPTSEVLKELDGKVLKPFSKLSLAEWIELDTAIADNNLLRIPAILYKQFKVDEWGNTVFEPFEYSVTDRMADYEDLSVMKIAGVISEAIAYRTTVYESFAELFEKYDEELTEEEASLLNPTERVEIEQEIKNDNRKKSFAWQRLLDNMSGGNWSTIPDVLELPHTFVLNMRLSRKVYGD